MTRLYPLLALSVVALAQSPCDARVTRLEIDQREVVADGQPFGAAGAYERLTGTAYFEVDPKDPHNAVVFDLDKAAAQRALARSSSRRTW